MNISGLGGGIMLALAALLWLVYLLPNWFKNREYLATEKNAVRLQQTIRVLAETAEVPRIVRADAAARRAANGPVSVGLPARPQPAPNAARPGADRAHRLRRARAGTSLILLASLTVALAQTVLMVTGGVAPGAVLVLSAAAIATLSAVAMLARLGAASRAGSVPVARVARRTSLGHAPVAVPEVSAEWTPVPLPKPVYLSRPQAPRSVPVDPAFELEIAAAAAERALRSIAPPPAVVPAATPAAAPAAVASRFASMGMPPEMPATAPDLNAVLARRRAVG